MGTTHYPHPTRGREILVCWDMGHSKERESFLPFLSNRAYKVAFFIIGKVGQLYGLTKVRSTSLRPYLHTVTSDPYGPSHQGWVGGDRRGRGIDPLWIVGVSYRVRRRGVTPSPLIGTPMNGRAQRTKDGQ